MKVVKLFHNPGAGEESHTKKDLVALIESEGFECRYSSTKKEGWEDIEPETDLVVIAGGDGTVRKVAAELLSRKLVDKRLPIGLLPLGTANNIAKTLGIEGQSAVIIEALDKQNIKKYDVGRVEGLKGVKFMIEGLGYGVFPKLIKDMREIDKQVSDKPEERMQIAMEKLHDIIMGYKPVYFEITIDEQDYSGKYLLVEVMNIRSIGPNLQLAPAADPGDGLFEVVLVGEDKREQLAVYVNNKLNGTEKGFKSKTIKGKKIQIFTKEEIVHVDDELLKPGEPEKIQIELLEGMLDFLVKDK
jgi:diacylglycerol kinase (ATP)